jgi:hypothetical protein
VDQKRWEIFKEGKDTETKTQVQPAMLQLEIASDLNSRSPPNSGGRVPDSCGWFGIVIVVLAKIRISKKRGYTSWEANGFGGGGGGAACP